MKVVEKKALKIDRQARMGGVVSVRLSQEDIEQLEHLAEQRGTFVSRLVRDAIQMLLAPFADVDSYTLGDDVTHLARSKGAKGTVVLAIRVNPEDATTILGAIGDRSLDEIGRDVLLLWATGRGNWNSSSITSTSGARADIRFLPPTAVAQ